MTDQSVRRRAAASGPSIDLDRLREEMTRLAAIGRVEGLPGINRPGYSDADMAARAFMAERMRDAGLAVSTDAVGNLSGLWDSGFGARVMAGSHLDTVPSGGFFDGALGVAAALECVRAMRDAGISPARPVEVIATAEEEGRFGGMLGAQALAGRVDPAWLQTAMDESGVRLADALLSQGFDTSRVGEAARDPADVHAFLELHIEQGPVLEAERLAVGIVDTISGVFKWSVRLTGIANHAGTTPMDMRRDAFLGLVAFAGRVPEMIAAVGTDQSRVTIGAVEVKPNHPHTVPGEAVFSLIGRDTDPAVMRALAAWSRERLGAIAEEAGLGLSIVEQSWLDPQDCDRDVVALLAREADALGLPHKVMPSGAGHDTQFLAQLTRAGLIFVPSIGGVSHAPDENTDWPDIEAGANLLLAAMIRLTEA